MGDPCAMVRRMRLGLCLLLLATAVACATDDLSADSYMDEDFPPWSCDTEATGPSCDSTGGSEGVAASCVGGFDCADGQVCAADFDGEIGTFECQLACIDAMDEQRWCF